MLDFLSSLSYYRARGMNLFKNIFNKISSYWKKGIGEKVIIVIVSLFLLPFVLILLILKQKWQPKTKAVLIIIVLILAYSWFLKPTSSLRQNYTAKMTPTPTADENGSCIGPDGKHIQLDPINCQKFNDAWKNSQKSQQVQVTPVVSSNQNATPMPTSTPIATSYDSSMGNNYVAAKYAQQFQDVANKAASGFVNSAYLDLEPSDMSNKSESAYKQSIVSAFLNIEVDSSYWNATGESGQKDLVAAWVNAVHNNFSGLPHVTITNGVRTVATGEWSIWNGEAKITLK
jgi:hypothetical protein